MKTTLFSSSIGDIKVSMAFINNLSATTDPGVSDDSGEGYAVGSVWVNATGNRVWTCTDNTAGAAVWVESGQAAGQVVAPANTAALVEGGAGTGTNSGAAATLQGGASGPGATGNGAAANITGGAAASTNGNGGSVVLTPGAKAGSGIAGGIRNEGLIIRAQGAPAAKTVSATLTAAELLSGIVTVTQGSGAPSAQQVPTGTAIQAGLPADFSIGDSFDVSVINLGGASEVASITVNTDVTLVGNAAIPVPASGVQSSGLFRFRKTADHVFVGYRIA